MIDIQPSGCTIFRSAFLVEDKAWLLLRIEPEGYQKCGSSDNMCNVRGTIRRTHDVTMHDVTTTLCFSFSRLQTYCPRFPTLYPAFYLLKPIFWVRAVLVPRFSRTATVPTLRASQILATSWRHVVLAVTPVRSWRLHPHGLPVGKERVAFLRTRHAAILQRDS